VLGRLPYYDSSASPAQWIIGYQYMGGMTNWNTGAGARPARSPIKTSTSRPHWALAADPLIRVNSAWGTGGGTPLYAWDDLPPHKAVGSKRPAGGNQVFIDGSGRWIKYETMSLFHQYNGGARQFFWYQDSSDFDTATLNTLTVISAKNFQ